MKRRGGRVHIVAEEEPALGRMRSTRWRGMGRRGRVMFSTFGSRWGALGRAEPVCIAAYALRSSCAVFRTT